MMHKIQKAVETWIFRLVTPALGTMSVALLVFLFLQTNNRTLANEQATKDGRVHMEQTVAKNSQRVERTFNAKCISIDKQLDNKVDNKALMRAIEIIEIKQSIDIRRWEDQKEFNKDVSESMKEMNKNIIILNERTK